MPAGRLLRRGPVGISRFLSVVNIFSNVVILVSNINNSTLFYKHIVTASVTAVIHKDKV